MKLLLFLLSRMFTFSNSALIRQVPSKALRQHPLFWISFDNFINEKLKININLKLFVIIFGCHGQ